MGFRTTNDCSTKRATMSAGKRSSATDHLVGLRCSPLDPADDNRRGEYEKRLKMNTPIQLLETFLHDVLDIERGDILVVDGIEYPVRGVAKWAQSGPQKAYTHLEIEDVRT